MLVLILDGSSETDKRIEKGNLTRPRNLFTWTRIQLTCLLQMRATLNELPYYMSIMMKTSKHARVGGENAQGNLTIFKARHAKF